jgi:hypothetical protein
VWFFFRICNRNLPRLLEFYLTLNFLGFLEA